ncbi:MAG TPA: hypothetical protein VGD40_11540 [Chryseosolibacter sp.]
MKLSFLIVCVIVTLFACEVKTKINPAPIEGTWKLVTGSLIEKGDTTVTDYTQDREMIKIINATHFSFLNHDTNKGSDTTRLFAAGGGKYFFDNGEYTEFLEYCSDRQWEGHEFKFRVDIKGDTLVQSGTEVIENLGINRLNIEKYVRLR